MAIGSNVKKGFFIVPVAVLTVLVIMLWGVYMLWENYAKYEPPAKINLPKIQLKQNPSPTPFPFQELTIPYLRQKTFSSFLAPLVKLNENAQYSSYLTSYSSDNLKINGLLTEPKSVKPEGGFPAVIFIHGYIPPESYRTGVNYQSYVDYLAKSGLVVFKIDLRGHDKSEGDASGAYYSGDYVSDTLNAYSALQNSGFVNPSKIGLWGHSMAGNIVFRSLVVKRDIPAAVIWAGAGYTYSDLTDYMINDNSYEPPDPDSERAKKRRELREKYGSFEPNHWFWKQVPGTNYLDGVKTAIQLNHAADDNVVSIEYSRNLIKILDKTSIPYEYNEYPSGGHNLTGGTFTEAMKNTVEFFRDGFK